jgi:hypothetical protein
VGGGSGGLQLADALEVRGGDRVSSVLGFDVFCRQRAAG